MFVAHLRHWHSGQCYCRQQDECWGVIVGRMMSGLESCQSQRSTALVNLHTFNNQDSVREWSRIYSIVMDLREWMINQQRQFQEFERSFGLGSGFGGNFPSLHDSFNDPFFASFHNRRQQHPLSLQHQQQFNHQHHAPNYQPQQQQPTSHLHINRDNSSPPRSKISFGDNFEIEINVEDFKPEVRL